MACSLEKSQNGRINKVLDENGKPSKLFQNIFNVPILSLEDSIEIYKNTFAEKVKQTEKSNKNVDFVFNQNKELSSIGTEEEYKQYLDTVFPNSRVDNVVYHGTKRDFDNFDEQQIGTESDKNKTIGDFGEGFYFTEVLTRAQGYATDMQTGKQVGRVISALVNIKNPDNSSQKTREQLLADGNDGVIVSYGNRKYDEIVLPNASQIYILGSQEDINNFRKWKSEPDLVFQTPAGEKYSSYSEALQNTPEGDIELRVNDVIVGKVNADTSINNYNGLLNHLTKQGILKSKRILDVNGDQLFIPSGETDSAVQLSANIIEEILNKQLGASSYVRFDDGSFTIEDNLDTRVINGEKIKESEISDLNYEQLKNKFGEETAISLEVERQFEKDLQPSKLKRRIDEDTQVKTEDELVRSAKNLLNKLGVQITSIEEYVKNDTIKNGGVPTSASALVDMVNKIVAFRDGTITREDLIEETSHLIEASLPLDRTIGIRRNIHNTPEFKEHSQKYYDIYSKEYAGEKLEDMVRREILGKVIANGISTNFELSQDATQTQQSIFAQIRQLLDEFFAKVNAYFNNNLQRQIDDLNQDIYVKLLSGELADELDVNQNFGDKFRLYSASTNLNNPLVQIQKQAEKALTILESQSYQIGRNDVSQRQQLIQGRESLGRAGEIIEESENQEDVMSKAQAEKLANAELASAFSYITNVAQKQLTYLQRAVKRNEDNSYHFSSEESAVYNSMITQFDKYILPSITSTLENKTLRTKAQDRILEEVKKVSESIEKLKRTVNVDEETYKKYLVDIMVKRLGLSADKRLFLEEKVNGLQKEANFMFTYFGNLMHSGNPFLNSAAHVVNKTDQERRQATLEQTLPFVQKLKKLNFLEGNKIKSLIKDGFIENRFNDKLREEALSEAKYNIYKEVSGSEISKLQFDNKENFNDLTTEQKSQMNQKLSDWKLENYTLSPLTPEEMQERRKRLEGYADVTQNFENVSSKFYADLMQNAVIVNGVPTFTQEMKYDFEQQKKVRAYTKSVYDLDGNLRDGIEYRSEQEYQRLFIEKDTNLETDIVKIANGLYVSLIPGTTNNDSILAFELSKIDNNRITELKSRNDEKEFSPKFIETLNSFTDPTEAYDFLMLNSYVGYTNDYYERLDRPSVIDRLREELGKDNDWKIENLIEKIATTTKKLNTILQANRVMNTPSEINYDSMEKNTEVPQVREYATLLENYYLEASSILGQQEEIEEDNLSETIPNEAFRAYMSDQADVSRLVYEKDVLDQDDIDNINKIFSNIATHSTLKNADRIASLRNFIKDFSSGRVNNISKTNKKIFKLTEQEYSEMSQEQIFSSMTNDLLQYSYTRLLPYFRKSQPLGADLALNQLRAGTLTSSEFIQNYLNGEYPFLNISPNYNFQQANEQNNKSPHFQQARAEGTPMFRTFESTATIEDVKTKTVDQLYSEGKLNKFVNKEFLKEYNIDLVNLFETGKETARTNNNKFDARQAFIDLQKQTLENYRMTNLHNIYQLPQKERGRLRKIEEFFTKGKGAKEIVDEATNYREDESSLGQNASGNNLRSTMSNTIPKFGLRKLKKGEISDSLLESYIWMNNESNLFEARTRNISDMLAIKEALLGSQFENNLKVESTNAYKMLEDQLKYSFFGVKETFSKEFQLFGKTLDLGQILKTFGGLIRLKNLAYNITIPVTSMLSGSVQLRIEKVIGERVDASGFVRGRKRFYKEAGDAMRDMFSLESTSWLNAMGSKFGFYENQERYNESEYGKTVRGLGRSAFIAHTAANFAPNSITALSVLSDHRFVDGKLLQYRDFKENNKGKSDKEIRAIWDDYTDIMDVSLVDENGVIYYDYNKIADALNTNMTEEEAKKFMEGKDALIAGRVKLAVQYVDQQVATVDKSILSRNAFTSFLGIHRNWLFLAVQNKLKSRQLSTLSGNFEEGSWATSFRVINSIVSDIKAGKTKDVLKYIHERWVNGSDTSRKNLIRGVAEMTFLNALIALTVMGIKELGDDDKNSYAFKVANLFLMRTTSEIASSTVALPKNAFDIMSNATVGTNLVDMAFDLPDLASSEEVSRGRFQGYSKRARYLLRNLPAVKDLYNLYDIDNTISSYRHFNLSDKEGGDNNLKYWTLYPILTDEE